MKEGKEGGVGEGRGDRGEGRGEKVKSDLKELKR